MVKHAVFGFVRSNAIAIVALVVALSGTSYAVVQLPRNSVTSQQIAPDAVRSGDVKNGSLRKVDFKSGQLPRGAAGPAGEPGPEGPAGRSALDQLESGESISGFVVGDYQAATVGGDWRAFVSFQVPLADVPSALYVDGVTPGEPCTGSAAVPTAPADKLCVYPLAAFNPVVGTNSHSASSFSRFGFGLGWQTPAVGDTFFSAVWTFTEG